MKKDYEPYKRMVRFLFSAVLIGLEVMVYGHVWLKYYNGFMEFPYNRTGNWLIMAVYGILLLVFSAIYGGLRIGYLRIFNIIYSQVLTSFCTNIIIYLQITLLTKHFQNPVPLLAMTGVEGVWITVWSVLCTQIYLRIYPPRKVVLVYGEHPVYSLMVKLYGRADRYDIKELVHISKGMDVIKEKVKQYEGVILCDIPSQMRNQLLKYCYNESIRTYMVPKISDIIIRSAENLHLFDTPLMLARNTGLSFEQQFIKRTFDIIIAVCALVVLSPIYLVTAACIKLYDRGPVIFKQKRYTKDGKIFDIYKFRSMRLDAESMGPQLYAGGRDVRLTKIGRFLREHHLDELPQLWNVFCGDMAFIGPRPERKFYIDQIIKHDPRYQFLYQIRPGVTSYATLYNGYTDTMDKMLRRLRYDLFYLQHRSWWFDFKILVKTFINICFGKKF